MKPPTEGGFELIVYQISQLEKAMNSMNLKFDGFQERIEHRIRDLEELRDRINLDELRKTINADNDWIKDQQAKKDYMQYIINLGSGIIGGTLAIAAFYFNFIRK